MRSWSVTADSGQSRDRTIVTQANSEPEGAGKGPGGGPRGQEEREELT